MAKMNILLIGGGGREHALVTQMTQSPLVGRIYCAPGNAGIREHATCLDIAQNDVAGLLDFAQRSEIDLTVVGPEQPLVAGIVDRFQAEGLNIFGPGAQAAEIEGSKAFSKAFMHKYKIPTATHETFEDHVAASASLDKTDFPVVIKADGLAAGKGVFVCHTEEQARTALAQVMQKRKFGDSGNKVVIEEFMTGEEVSVFAFCDGENLVYLPSAQDHKAIFDNDEGPNTGGMGAYAPAPIMTEELLQQVDTEIMRPTVSGLAREGRPYRGVLYAGLMITSDGPKVVEFNCRLGDPEAQVILPLVKSDLVEIMFRIAKRKRVRDLEFSDDWAMCVVLASGGYPGSYETGKQILGLEKNLGSDIRVYHAGTKSGPANRIVTDGGRVLGVTALAGNFDAVRERAYWAVGKIAFDNAYYRKDIGMKALSYLRK